MVEALARSELGEKQLGVRGEMLDRAREAIDALAAGRGRPLAACDRYTGVVWDHLGAATLAADQRAAVIVPSALLGLVTGNDPVPDHRLKFDVSLVGIGRLDRFWRPLVTEALRSRPATTFIELLPNEHRAAIDWDEVGRSRKHTLVRTAFTGATGHEAKAVKGVLARHLLDHGLDAIDRFAWHDWSATYDAEALQLTISR